MSYTIRLSDGSVFTTIADQSIDSKTLPISLVGRGAINYGTDFAQNFVHMLENFNSTQAPKNPLVGQLWFDRGTNKLRYYVGQWLEITQGTPSSFSLPNTVVVRDANGSFSANIVTANLNGIADSARRWTTPRKITLSNDVVGSVVFDGSSDFTLPVTVNHGVNADRWTTTRVLTLAGDVNGAVNIDGTGNMTLPVTVNHSTTADRWTTPRSLSLTGSILGSVVIDGSGNVSLNTSYNTSGGSTPGVVPITVSASQNALYANEAGHAVNADHALYADRLTTARQIAITGDMVGAAMFDGTANIQINGTIGGLATLNNGLINLQATIPQQIQQTLTIGRVPVNFVRISNNNRAAIFTGGTDWYNCMGPFYYNKTRDDTNILVFAEVSSYNPTYGGFGATNMRMIDANQTNIQDTKGLASAFLTQTGAYNVGDTAVFALVYGGSGGKGVHAYWLQCFRGGGYFTTVFNPDSADFNGGAHSATGATSSFTFMEIIP